MAVYSQEKFKKSPNFSLNNENFILMPRLRVGILLAEVIFLFIPLTVPFPNSWGDGSEEEFKLADVIYSYFH